MTSATIITVFNHKGGVGKTTTAVNLAAGLCLGYGKRCLVVDMDPQANATRALLGMEVADAQPTMRDVLLGEGTVKRGIWDVVVKTAVPGLSVAVADLSLSEVELKLASRMSREFVLRECMGPVVSSFDFIIIDCPPSLGLLTLNALASCQGVIIPCECQFMSLRGLRYVLDILNLVKARLNPAMKVLGVLPTKFYVLSKANNEVLDCMRNLKYVHVFDAVIARDVKAEEAPSHGRSILEYAPESRASAQYRKFAGEVLALCQG